MAFEVALTRIFSISLWYHFAFMVISIALLGYGASGSILMLFPSLKRDPPSILPFTSSLFGLTTILSYITANQVPFDPARLAWDPYQALHILILYILLSMPFLFAGLTLGLALSFLSHKAGRVYASDLTGAGLGCLLVLPLFSPFQEGVVIVISLVVFLSSIAFTLKMGLLIRIIPLAGISLSITLIGFQPSFLEIRVSPYKDLPFALRYPGARLIETRWDSVSRVDLLYSPAVRFAPGLSLRYLEPLPPQIGLTIDGGGLNAITRFREGDRLDFIDYLPSSLPYYLGKRKDVFLIEPMGGLPILTAIHYSATSIYGAERNPLAITLSDSDFSGYIYKRAKIILGDGRAVLKGVKRDYDLIEIGISEANASTSGLYGLLEDYQFTKSAFKDYYSHLKDGGTLSITRYLLPPPRTEIRLVSTIVEALEGIGVKEPKRQLAIIRTWGTITILLKKGVFTQAEIDAVKGFCSSRRFDLVHYPGMRPEEANIYNRFPEPIYYDLVSRLLDQKERDKLYNGYLFDITPTTDDRPFFHHIFRLKTIREVLKEVGGKWQILLEGGYLIPLVFVQALLASSILILLPILRIGGFPGLKALLYFFFIGIGFIFLEVSLIQRFIIFLTHPTHAFAGVVFSILVSSGIGSFLSQRIGVEKGGWVIIPLLGFFIPFYTLFLPQILSLLLGQTLIVRQLLTFFILFPIGLFMGMPFPLGIRALEIKGKVLIPWAWAVNGCATVVGSIGAVMVAIPFGFRWVCFIAGIGYLLAWMVGRRI